MIRAWQNMIHRALKGPQQRNAQSYREASQAYRQAVEMRGLTDRLVYGDGMGELPAEFPRKGPTEEARAYAYARDLVVRVGPSEASRIADLVVKNVQMFSREPRE